MYVYIYIYVYIDIYFNRLWLTGYTKRSDFWSDARIFGRNKNSEDFPFYSDSKREFLLPYGAFLYKMVIKPNLHPKMMIF